MKTTFYISMLYLLTVGIYAAEEVAIDKQGSSTAILKEEISPEGDLRDWHLVVPSEGNPGLKIPPELVENFRSIIRNMAGATSIDDAPIEILLQEPALLRGLLVSTGFYLKSTAITVANLYAWICPQSLSSILRTVSTPAVYNYAHKVTEGDVTNFPEISLNYVYELLDGVPDRKTFEKFPLRKRAFPFETKGFNGFGKGYVGQAIVQDFAYGQRLVSPGEEYTEVSKNIEKNPLDCLVSLKEHILLSEWLRLRFVRPNPMNLRKVGSTFKDMFGNSCILYELAAPPDSLFLLVMRKPEQEYLELIEIWKEVWRRNHVEEARDQQSSAEGAERK